MFFQKSRINICVIQKILVPLHPLKKKHRGVEQLVARQAHNLEVARSNPASATKQKRSANQLIRAFLLSGILHFIRANTFL